MQISPGGRLNIEDVIEPATSFGPASYDFRWQLVKRWWERARP